MLNPKYLFQMKKTLAFLMLMGMMLIASTTFATEGNPPDKPRTPIGPPPPPQG